MCLHWECWPRLGFRGYCFHNSTTSNRGPQDLGLNYLEANSHSDSWHLHYYHHSSHCRGSPTGTSSCGTECPASHVCPSCEAVNPQDWCYNCQSHLTEDWLFPIHSFRKKKKVLFHYLTHSCAQWTWLGPMCCA